MPPVIPFVAGIVFKAGVAVGLEAATAAAVANVLAPLIVSVGVMSGISAGLSVIRRGPKPIDAGRAVSVR